MDRQLKRPADIETFFTEAPALNPSRRLITGVVCGVRVEDIPDPMMREVRYLDKLVDELAKGKALDKVLRVEQAAAPGQGDVGDEGPIAAYAEAQPPAFRAVCDRLRDLIDPALPTATAKVWHGSPVWFVGDNPVVGYKVTAKAVGLLFWNGQAFDEPALNPVGKYRAAEAAFRDAAEIDAKAVRRWLKKAKADVFDSKAFFKTMRERAGGHPRD